MPNKRRLHPESGQRGWHEHSLSQLRYFRSLSLREKLQAVEGMADVVRQFHKIRSQGGFKPASRRATELAPADFRDEDVGEKPAKVHP